MADQVENIRTPTSATQVYQAATMRKIEKLNLHANLAKVESSLLAVHAERKNRVWYRQRVPTVYGNPLFTIMVGTRKQLNTSFATVDFDQTDNICLKRRTLRALHHSKRFENSHHVVDEIGPAVSIK